MKFIREGLGDRMSTPRKPPVTFEVAFDGKGIYPENVGIGYLARTFSAIQRLALGPSAGWEEDSEGLAESRLGLMQVRRGSAVYAIAAPVPTLALAHLRETGQVLRNPEGMGESDFVLSPIEELSGIARMLKAEIVVREPGRGGHILATIGPDSYRSLTQNLLVSGDSSLTGKVERVGGATEQKCGLRVPGRSWMLHCKVESVDAARQLGQHLYEKVTVHGTAKWLRTNWRIVAFSIRDVYRPQLSASGELIESLRSAGGSDWDRVADPAAFIEGKNGRQ